MNASTDHRGIGYSTADLGKGRWRWTLHPKKPVGALTEAKIHTREVSGTRDDAIAAAKKAIDAMKEQKSI